MDSQPTPCPTHIQPSFPKDYYPQPLLSNLPAFPGPSPTTGPISPKNFQDALATPKVLVDPPNGNSWSTPTLGPVVSMLSADSIAAVEYMSSPVTPLQSPIDSSVSVASTPDRKVELRAEDGVSIRTWSSKYTAPGDVISQVSELLVPLSADALLTTEGEENTAPHAFLATEGDEETAPYVPTAPASPAGDCVMSTSSSGPTLSNGGRDSAFSAQLESVACGYGLPPLPKIDYNAPLSPTSTVRAKAHLALIFPPVEALAAATNSLVAAPEVKPIAVDDYVITIESGRGPAHSTLLPPSAPGIMQMSLPLLVRSMCGSVILRSTFFFLSLIQLCSFQFVCLCGD